MKIKTSFKIIITLGIILLICLVFNINNAKAVEISNDDIILENDLVENLIENIKINNQYIHLEYNFKNLGNLMNNKNLLDEKVKEDNCVYDYFYIKVKSSNMQIINNELHNMKVENDNVIINGNKYIKVAFKVAELRDNDYYYTSYNSIKFELENSEKIYISTNIYSLMEEYANEDNNIITPVTIILANSDKMSFREVIDTSKEYRTGMEMDAWEGTFRYDRIVANKDCYIVAYTSLYLGDNLYVRGFGTLDYIKATGSNDFDKYIYAKKISNKAMLFNNESVNFQVILENAIGEFTWRFVGDLVKTNPDVIDLFEDTMQLDIPEIEYEKAKEIISFNIEKILKDNNFINERVEVINYPISLIHGIDKLYKATIKFNNNEEKEINLVYNNTDKHDILDEQLIKNLKLDLEKKYFEVEFNKFLSLATSDNMPMLLNEIGKYYESQILNNEITVKCDIGLGEFTALNFWSSNGRFCLGIFKNGILYDILRVKNETIIIPYISVPSNIMENELNNYIISNIEKYNSNYAKSITKIEKGIFESDDFLQMPIKDIENCYTVYSKDYPYSEKDYVAYITDYCYIIVKKEVKNINEQTSIELETNTTVVPENTILVAEEVEKEETLDKVKESIKEEAIKFKTYDITLMSDGVAVQPNGKVKISIPVPEGFDANKIIVYRIEEDGSKIKYETIVENGYIVFETDHFSIYVLAEKNEFKLGDVNKDGKVNSLDATLILKYVAKKKTLDVEQLKLADVTKDGKVNSLDAVRILKYVAKKITEF